MTIEDFLGRFEGVRKNASGWTARCPAHDDRRQSLSISQGEKGIVLKCFAGCETKDVLAKLGLKERDLFPREKAPARGSFSARRSGRPEAIYPYRNAQGRVLFEVLRFPGKDFRQRRPDPSRPGAYVYNLDGVSRVPYRLPELLQADPLAVVFIVEGEKDAGNLSRLGEVATTNPEGSSNSKLWDTAPFREPLRGRDVVILPDNDEPGRKHAERVARAIQGHARSVKVLNLPALPAKGDVSDWMDAGGTQAKLRDMVAATKPWKPPARTEGHAGDPKEGDDRERPTQARLLVAIAQEHAELFKTTDGEAYATIRRSETLAVRSKAFRSFLLGEFFNAYDKTPSSQGLKEAVDALETLAHLGTVTRTTFLRVGAQDSRFFIDLGDTTRRIVEVCHTGWRVVAPDATAIRFRRTSSMRPLPEPTRGGDINDLRRFLNVGDEEWRWQLLLVWLLFTFQPSGPFPVLVLQGEQGCAKSTTARVLRALIDPSQAPLRLPPMDEDKLLVSAKSSWVLAFDNLSGMPRWLSDRLCCLATGTAQSKRALYTDDEEYIIEATRPVSVNGIDDMTARPDFASRALAVDLPQIRDDQRQEEADFWAAFTRARPAILGAALSVVAEILAIRDQVIVPAKPRMADFARFGVAAERVLGWRDGSFLAANQTSQADSAAVTLESNLVAVAVHKFMTELEHAEWEDTASALLPKLVAQLAPGQDRTRGWPANASQLGNQLRRCAPILRQYGIEAEQLRSHGERFWRLTRTIAENRAKTASPPAPFRKPAQIPLVNADGRGDGSGPTPNPPCHPHTDGVTAGAVGVPPSDASPSPRWGDVGAGQDGTFSCCSEEEGEGYGDASDPDPTGGQP
jgi:5S rRNA maturation endonuclease (ribonuclease M5)